jgi:hypothetical protein
MTCHLIFWLCFNSFFSHRNSLGIYTKGIFPSVKFTVIYRQKYSINISVCIYQFSGSGLTRFIWFKKWNITFIKFLADHERGMNRVFIAPVLPNYTLARNLSFSLQIESYSLCPSYFLIKFLNYYFYLLCFSSFFGILQVNSD